MLAVQARGKEILTVEGLAQDGELDLLQQKFVEYGAVQCGYCTPGMLMSAKALLMGNPVPSEQDIRIALAGNLCRCTGYSAIVAAVKAASGHEATPAMELPAEPAELAAEVTTDPDILAAACEVVEAETGVTPGGPCARAASGLGDPLAPSWLRKAVSDVAVTEVRSPSSLDELVAALAQATPRTRLLAGGTDLVRTLRQPGEEPDVLIDLSGLEELKTVRLDGETLHVGALATFQQLQWDPLVREHAYCLSLAAAQVGSAQIRNAGTLGGNVANASPCADGVTALTALGADVTTVDGAGATRTRPIGEVVLGPSRTEPRARRGRHRVRVPGARPRAPLGLQQDRIADRRQRRPAQLRAGGEVRCRRGHACATSGSPWARSARPPSAPQSWSARSRAFRRTRRRHVSSREAVWRPCRSRSPAATRCRTSSTRRWAWPTTPGTCWR